MFLLAVYVVYTLISVDQASAAAEQEMDQLALQGLDEIHDIVKRRAPPDTKIKIKIKNKKKGRSKAMSFQGIKSKPMSFQGIKSKPMSFQGIKSKPMSFQGIKNKK